MIYQIPVGTGFEMRRKIFPALVFPPVLWYAGIRQKTTGVDTMAEQEMLLDTATIRAAGAGEKWAKEKVIEHYTPLHHTQETVKELTELSKEFETN